MNELIRSNSKCPYCLQPVLHSYQRGRSINQNNALGPESYNPYWQPASNKRKAAPNPIIVNNNYNNNYNNNQGFIPQPYVPQINNRIHTGRYYGLSLFFLILTVILIIIGIQMGDIKVSSWIFIGAGLCFFFQLLSS